MSDTCTVVMHSPIGDITIEAEDGAVVALHLGRTGTPRAATGVNADVAERARDELEAYFAGRLRRFTVPVRGRGTPFQQKVWQALCTIPYGETVSYRNVAERIGSPNAMRAVGAANGANPVAIIVPCHRVIGANGALVGYGGGLERKTWLLEHERGGRLV